MSPNSNFLERVRDSCGRLDADEAKVDSDAAMAFVKSLDVEKVKFLGSNLANIHEHDAVASGTSFNVSFPNAAAEINMISVAHALDFGSGFRHELHAYTGKGSWLSIKDGLENMYRKNPSLSAEWLASLGETEVGELFNISATSADGSPSGLALLITHLTNVSNELGSELLKRGHASLGSLVHENVLENETAAALVQKLAETFPSTFNDVHTYKGQTVYFYKKAQLVTGELYHRFHAELAEFNFPDATRMTCFVDNVICATMRKTGVVVCSEALTKAIESRELLPSGSKFEVAFRAKALTGVELVCEMTGNKLVPLELGNYLWAALGKEPDFRKFARHHTQDTVFY